MECVDYRNHEAGMDHRHTGRVTRWRAIDGCSGESCADCRVEIIGLERIDEVDLHGLPLDPAVWTEAERLIDRARRGLPVDSGSLR